MVCADGAYVGLIMKKYEILGIKIKDHSVRETLKLTRETLSHNKPSSVLFLTRDVLLQAENSETLKRFIEEEADVTMISSAELYRAAGAEDRTRVREIDRNLYLKGLLRILSRERRRIYLLTSDPGQMVNLKSLLGTFENSLQVAGSYDTAVLSGEDTRAEDITNDINSVTPDVVFAIFEGEGSADFVNMGKKYMNTGLIVLLQPEQLKFRQDGSVKSGFMTRLTGRLFTRIAGRYR